MLDPVLCLSINSHRRGPDSYSLVSGHILTGLGITLF